MVDMTLDEFCQVCMQAGLHTIRGDGGKNLDRYATAYACSDLLDKAQDTFCVWDGVSFSDNGVGIGYYDSLVLTENGTYRIGTADGSGLPIPIKDAQHLHEVCRQFDYTLYSLETYPSYRPKTIKIG